VSLKTCNVVLEGHTGVTHSVEVTAETLYEAIAQALAAYREESWVGDDHKRFGTVTVTVRSPEVKHIVKLQDFDNWLNSANKGPADLLLKERLRRLMNGHKK
jgi:hypothetical protein